MAGPFCYSPSGKALYGQCTPYHERADERTKVALCKLDLDANSTTPVPGSMGVYVAGLAVSQRENRILVLGVHQGDTETRRGLFEISLPDGRLRSIFQQSERTYYRPSLSPDGKRAVVNHKGRLELIDVSRGTSEPIGDEFHIAEWSPDGKWLAALENGEEGRTILMDSETLTRRRTLGHTQLHWSPDSRYLLGLKSCDEFYGTLEAIDVQTGEGTTVQSSKCQVDQATTGWVGSEIVVK